MDFFVNQFESKMINLSSSFEKKPAKIIILRENVTILGNENRICTFWRKIFIFPWNCKIAPIRFHEFLLKSIILYFDRVNIKNWAVIVFSQKIEDSQLKLAFWIHFSNRYLSSVYYIRWCCMNFYRLLGVVPDEFSNYSHYMSIWSDGFP